MQTRQPHAENELDNGTRGSALRDLHPRLLRRLSRRPGEYFNTGVYQPRRRESRTPPLYLDLGGDGWTELSYAEQWDRLLDQFVPLSDFERAPKPTAFEIYSESARIFDGPPPRAYLRRLGRCLVPTLDGHGLPLDDDTEDSYYLRTLA